MRLTTLLAVLPVLAGFFIVVTLTRIGFASDGVNIEDPAPSVSPAEAEVRTEKAREHFVRGLALGREGNWSRALEEFLASRAQHSTRAARLNIAVSLYNLRRYAEALQAYEELDRDSGETVSKEEKQKIQAIVAKLSGLVAELLITGNTVEPTIRIDDRDYGSVAARTPLRIDPGLHKLRVSKPGYVPVEREFSVQSGETKEVDVSLLRVSEVSRLQVREAEGRTLDVLLDGVFVGKTPFSGVVSQGPHTVTLRGPGRLGSLPLRARVARGEQVSLSVRAVELDARVRILPMPRNARIDFDGVPLGVGIWDGWLPSGAHMLEVHAEGHWSKRVPVDLRPGSHSLSVVLVPARPEYSSSAAFLRSLYVELSAGVAWSPYSTQGAGAVCEDGSCDDESRPLGALFALRPGYRLSSRLGIELALGYVRLSASQQRRLEVFNTDPDPVSFQMDANDEARISAPFAGLGFSYRVFDEVPILLRLTTGAARAEVRTAVSGRFRASIPHPEHPDVVVDYDQPSDLLEEPQSLWLPFLTPELRVGYPVSKRLTLDIGLAAWLFLAPSYPRTGGLFNDAETRSLSLPEVVDGFPLQAHGYEGSTAVKPGIVRLPRENALGSMLVLSPSVAARWSF